MSLNNLFIDLKVFAVLFWEFVSFIHFLLGCCSYGFLGILYILAFFFFLKKRSLEDKSDSNSCGVCTYSSCQGLVKPWSRHWRHSSEEVDKKIPSLAGLSFQ